VPCHTHCGPHCALLICVTTKNCLKHGTACSASRLGITLLLSPRHFISTCQKQQLAILQLSQHCLLCMQLDQSTRQSGSASAPASPRSRAFPGPDAAFAGSGLHRPEFVPGVCVCVCACDYSSSYMDLLKPTHAHIICDLK